MPIYTVSQVTRYVKESLEQDSLLGDLWVSGEVSNLRAYSSGHNYFTVKDSQSQLRCVMFKGGRGADLLVEGSLVIAHGRVSFYESRGDVQLLADVVMPEGTGPLHLELERLKMRLQREGLFEPSRKRPLPRFPKVIGLVTSPSGAVLHDIGNVIGRRYPLVELLLAPAQVQGEGAGASIVSALNALNEDGRSDVIILARGGGSIEELWPFNEEAVARAIYASRIPTVSAVGHERDHTISDDVADVRAPTPSAAAELVVPEAASLVQELQGYRSGLARALSDRIQSRRLATEGLARDLRRHAPDLDTMRRRVDDLARAASSALAARLSRWKDIANGHHLSLQALNPRAILHRGYAIVEKQPEGAVVSTREQVTAGEELKVTVSDGAFEATAGAVRDRKRRRQHPVTAGARLL